MHGQQETHMRNAVRGFSLLELMMAVAIIGILAAIAVPSYSNYVLRAQRTMAKTVLNQVVARQDAFFTDRKTYATNLGPTGLGYKANPFYIGKDGNPTDSTSGAVYVVALENPTATSYTVTATAYSTQQKKDTNCYKLSLASTGAKSATKIDNSAGSADCWTR
jgi:type IV pilus assembly protein PilE